MSIEQGSQTPVIRIETFDKNTEKHTDFPLTHEHLSTIPMSMGTTLKDVIQAKAPQHIIEGLGLEPSPKIIPSVVFLSREQQRILTLQFHGISSGFMNHVYSQAEQNRIIAETIDRIQSVESAINKGRVFLIEEA